ncbi:MAG: hypothetical protein MZW92_63205 [Comamonadaceae bacterium]|nr:hypothetical protein [Comamonadaceae bacterium]
MGTRGDFYDQTGALRDMIQNHALQLLTMIAMEPPSEQRRRRHPRREAQGAEVAQARSRPRPWRATWCAASTSAGSVGGQAVPGYLDEVKVPAGSRCETFVALRTEVQNWRWAGVPFYLRTGKRLAARDCAHRRQLPRGAAPDLPGHAAGQQAGHQAAARGRAGTAPAGGQGRRRQRDCCRRCRWTSTSTRPSPSERVGGYERLLLDALAGRLNLFVRSDEQEQAWRWVEPVLRRLGARPAPARAPTPPAAGARRRPARWSRATAAPGPRSSETGARRATATTLSHARTHHAPRSLRCRRPSSAWRGCCWPTRAASPRCR